MNWRHAHRLAMLKAAHLHRVDGIVSNQQVDVFGAIDRSGILLGFQPFPKLSGAYFNEPGAQVGIVINSNHSAGRQRFTAAHEFGHHVFEHGTKIDSERPEIDLWTSEGSSDDEKVAEAFAAWFLMPPQLVRSTLASFQLAKPDRPLDVYLLSLRLGTSYEATARHLGNLGYGTPVKVEQWLKYSPAELKRMAGGPWVPSNLRNDVWVLGARDVDATVVVHPGDRIMLHLPEIPSAGYAWQLNGEPSMLKLIGNDYLTTDGNLLEASADVSKMQLSALEVAVGDSLQRRFIFEVESASKKSASSIGLSKARPWVPDHKVDSLRIDLVIEPLQRGVPERYFTQAA